MFDPIITSYVGRETVHNTMLQTAKVNDRDITLNGVTVFKKCTLLFQHYEGRVVPIRWWQIFKWFKPRVFRAVAKFKYKQDGWNNDVYFDSKTYEIIPTPPIYQEIDVEKLFDLNKVKNEA